MKGKLNAFTIIMFEDKCRTIELTLNKELVRNRNEMLIGVGIVCRSNLSEGSEGGCLCNSSFFLSRL